MPCTLSSPYSFWTRDVVEDRPNMLTHPSFSPENDQQFKLSLKKLMAWEVRVIVQHVSLTSPGYNTMGANPIQRTTKFFRFYGSKKKIKMYIEKGDNPTAGS
ncbi:hypothetical protein MPTK1_6g10865 [Marchantia polymorpha subsp. ruderalis]